MPSIPNRKPFSLHGRLTYRLRSLLSLYRSTFAVTVRRLLRGPRHPGWTWNFETAIHFLKSQTNASFTMPNPADGREYEDSLVFYSPTLDQVDIRPVDAPVKGHWYLPKTGTTDRTLLYFHGGGYAYYSAAHRNLIALVALTARARTFAHDYRLIPEHPFPAQLEDALAAYRWLLGTGVDPHHLILAGDSAGGNLTLAALLALRDSRTPLPALAVCISPWTDAANPGASMTADEPYDWVDHRMPDRWSAWFCRDASPANPLVSPVHADLRGLPPIYIQAGDAEILYDMIRAFTECAQQQGADVQLDVWPGMNHDFQAFGDGISESKAALQRMGEVVASHLPG